STQIIPRSSNEPFHSSLAPDDAVRFNRAMVGLTDPTSLLRVPRATYRLQLGPDLTFDVAAGLVPYLASLGISDCYISPFFEAASNRSHGYDVSDHGRFRAELGGEPAFYRLAPALPPHR